MKIRNVFWNIYVKNILIAAAVLIVLIFMVMLWLNAYTHHGKQVTVPDIKELPVEQAAQILVQKSLQYTIVDSMYVRNKPAGCVREVVPPAGTNVKIGRTVYLTVNSVTAQMLTVPRVADMSRRQAETTLRSLGFDNIQIRMQSGAYKDLVIQLENAKGIPIVEDSRLPANTPLVLAVSSGEMENSDTREDGAYPIERGEY
jgi:hypothetical protein